LVPVANRPVLDYVMKQISDAGLRDVGVVIAPETGDQVRAALSENRRDLNLTFIVQDRPAGLAHAVRMARDYLGDESFVMILGDNLIGQGLQQFVERFELQQPDALVLLKEVSDPSLFGVAVVNGDGRIVRLIEKPKRPPSKLALVGIYLFSPSI